MRRRVREWLFEKAGEFLARLLAGLLKEETWSWALILMTVLSIGLLIWLYALVLRRIEEAKRKADEIAERMPPEEWHAPSAEEVARIIGPRRVEPPADKVRAIDKNPK